MFPLRSLVITKLFSVTLPEFNTVPLKVSNPPGEVAVGGQVCVSTRTGVVRIEQVEFTMFVTKAPQTLRPIAVDTLETEQLVGAVKLALKFTTNPGSRIATVSRGAAPVWLFSTTMLVRVILPEFRTVPANRTTPPGTTGTAGHVCVTARAGVVKIAQTALAELVTKAPQRLRPDAVDVLDTEQFVGAAKLPLKFTTNPGSRVGTTSRGFAPVRLLTTTILVSVMFPEFRTVPL